jgi:hypothetical protein
MKLLIILKQNLLNIVIIKHLKKIKVLHLIIFLFNLVLFEILINFNIH